MCCLMPETETIEKDSKNKLKQMLSLGKPRYSTGCDTFGPLGVRVGRLWSRKWL